jgi:Protein of unknown function (DUF4242)
MRRVMPRRHARNVVRTRTARGTKEYLAECLWPGVTEDELAELDLRAFATTSGSDGYVRYLGSILMPDDEVVFFRFSAPSPHAVQAVAERAGIPFERIVESVRRPGPDEREET